MLVWVRLGFIASVEGLLGGCLVLLVLVLVWLVLCLFCIVSVKSFLASHFIWVTFLQSGIALFGIFHSIKFNSIQCQKGNLCGPKKVFGAHDSAGVCT